VGGKKVTTKVFKGEPDLPFKKIFHYEIWGTTQMNRFGIKFGIILCALIAISCTSVVADINLLPIQGDSGFKRTDIPGFVPINPTYNGGFINHESGHGLNPLGFDSSFKSSEFIYHISASSPVYVPKANEPSNTEDIPILEEFDKPTQPVEFASSFPPIKPYTNYPNVLNPLQAGFLLFQEAGSQRPLTLTGKGLSIQFQGVTQDEAIALIRESNPFLTRIIPVSGFGPKEDNSVIIFVFTDYSTHDELISELHLNPHVVSIWDDMLT
jgi:hypothetical protein